MSGHILKNGYDFCKWEHYRELADNRPDLLSLAFVYNVIDQQCAAKAHEDVWMWYWGVLPIQRLHRICPLCVPGSIMA